MPRSKTPSEKRGVDTTLLAVLMVSGLVAAIGSIGADARWLAALGGAIVKHGSVPDGVPFASAPSAGWPNAPALAEMVFHGLEALLGDRGIMLAQIAATTAALGLLGWDLRRGGCTRSAAPVLALVALGSLPSLVAARGQLFSLVLFPLMLTLLRTEARRPSGRVWLLVPLAALWSNLHGAVLVGLATAAAYLVLERARRQPLVAAGVLAASTLALAATPALARTASYYHGVMENEAARRGFGLWAPLSLHAPLDVLLLVAAVPLLGLALRSRPPLWELAALAGLAALTVQTARGAVWLFFLAALPAARALPARCLPARVSRIALVPVLGLALLGVGRGPLPLSAGPGIVDAAIASAAGKPILAETVPAEQIAVAGGRVWMGNPLDAFPSSDQRLYLDWLQGRPQGDSALTRARVVLVMRGSKAQRRLATQHAFRELRRDARAVLYLRG